MAPIGRFRWTTFDVQDLLPSDWSATLLSIADRFAVTRTLVAASVTSRELTPLTEVPALTVGGRALREHAPWLYALYKGEFRSFGETVAGRPVVCAADDRYGAVLNVQRGGDMRYECHVDSNPLEGLLYVTTHPPGEGGELVVARRPQAHSVAEVDEDCDVVFPVRGHLIFFDARAHPHYVRALSRGGVRAVVAMNFYTADCPESNRPADLNRHLFGED
jgi:hypothetical protein